jgi:hypothetical protein
MGTLLLRHLKVYSVQPQRATYRDHVVVPEPNRDMNSNRSGPSRVWYWVGGAIVLTGLAAGAVWGVLGFRSLSNRVDQFQRLPVDGGGDVTLTAPGPYTVYYEGPGAGDEGALVPCFHISLVAFEGGKVVELSDYGGSLTYNVGGHSGRAVATFRVEEPGRYTLRTSSLDRGGLLAVGRGVGKRLVTTVAGALALAVLGIGFGAAVLIITAVRRRARRRHPLPGGPAQP